MRCYYLFISLFLSLPLFGQYQGIPMTGSNIKPNQIRWTRDIGTDSIFVMASDTVTGKPYWFACKKSTLLSGGSGSTNTDGQQLSLLAGGGTLKLTQLTGASNFVQLKDSTITNEGILSMANPLFQVITISSNTSTSPTLTINGGAGLDLQYSAPTTFSITNTGDLSTTNEIQSLSLLSGGGTLKLTKGAGGGLSNFVQLRDSSITNELQTLSIFAGKGTIKLTNGASASTFIQLADSTITNEGKLTLTAPSGGIAYINSNTSTSASIGLNEGDGIALSSGGANIVTITNSKPNTDAQALSLLAGGGTLKLTKVGAVSDFVQLRDSSISNEGKLSVSAGSASTSVITSNTSGSSAVTLKAGSGVTLSESVDTITIASSGITSIKEAKKSDRLGIIVVSDSVGFDYKKLTVDDFIDTLMFVPVFDSTTNRNKKISIKELYYDPFAETVADADFTLSLVNGVDSVVRFDEGFAYLWSYTKSTGKLKYNGSRALYFKIDAGVQFQYANGSPQPDVTTLKIRRNNSEVKLTKIGNLPKVTGSNVPAIISGEISRLLYIYPGDEIDITLKPDYTRSATIKSGYLNIIAISRQSAF